MAKTVRYNGGTDTFYPCTKPTKLVVGKEYVVISSEDRGFHTNYVLAGVEGKFNSVWFDEVTEDDKVYVALSRQYPVIGKPYVCYRIEYSGDKVNLKGYSTTPVKAVQHLGNNIYYVTTQNSVYVVSVHK